jgi:hypothetical protein
VKARVAQLIETRAGPALERLLVARTEAPGPQIELGPRGRRPAVSSRQM